MNTIMWWTGLVVWIAVTAAGACVAYVLIIATVDELIAERLKRSGRMTKVLIFLTTWAYRKDGREMDEAVEIAIGRHRHLIREEVEKDVRSEMADEIDSIEDQLCRERARSMSYCEMLDAVCPNPTEEQMDTRGKSCEHYYRTEKAILAEREKEAKQ